jgi:hypothetical protein
LATALIYIIDAPCVGTAVWLFLAKPVTPDTETFSTGYDIVLDGVPVDSDVSLDENDRDEYNQLAFSNDTLPLGPHSIQMIASDGETVWFDYAVFTYGCN